MSDNLVIVLMVDYRTNKEAVSKEMVSLLLLMIYCNPKSRTNLAEISRPFPSLQDKKTQSVVYTNVYMD